MNKKTILFTITAALLLLVASCGPQSKETVRAPVTIVEEPQPQNAQIKQETAPVEPEPQREETELNLQPEAAPEEPAAEPNKQSQIPVEPNTQPLPPIEPNIQHQTAIEEPWDGVIHQACLQAKKEMGNIEYEFTEKIAAADFEKVLREYAERGFDLIVGDAFLAGEEPARRVAKDYPNIAFAFGSEFGPVAPNFSAP